MLGRRGQFEGVADWLPVLPLWSAPCVQPSERQDGTESMSQYRSKQGANLLVFDCLN